LKTVANLGCGAKFLLGSPKSENRFRNEITPGNFTFRTRDSSKWNANFRKARKPTWSGLRLGRKPVGIFTQAIGIRTEKLRFKEHGPGELAHYAKAAFDVQYEFPFGWNELEGIHNRSDFDLREHKNSPAKNSSISKKQRKKISSICD